MKNERKTEIEFIQIPKKEFIALLNTLASPWFGHNEVGVRQKAAELRKAILEQSNG